MRGLMDDHGPPIIAEGSLPLTTYLPAPKVAPNFYLVAAGLAAAALLCVGIGWWIDEMLGMVAGAGAAIAAFMPLAYLLVVDAKALAREEANEHMQRHSMTGGAFVTMKLQQLDEIHRAQLQAVRSERDTLAAILQSTGVARDPKTGRLLSAKKVAGPMIGSTPLPPLIEGSSER